MLLSAGAIAPPHACASFSENETRELRPLHPIEETIRQSSPHIYWFNAEPGDVFNLQTEQYDLTLKVTVTRPDGSRVMERLTPYSGATPIAGHADLAGRYGVQVDPEPGDGRVRKFSICLRDIGSYNFRRALELAASAALAVADKLAAQWTQADLTDAARQFGRAANAYSRAGDQEDASIALVRQAGVYAIRGRLEEALATYRVSLKLLPREGPVTRRIDTLNAMAQLELAFSKFDEATTDAELADRLSKSAAYDRGHGSALAEVGLIALFRNNTELARSSLAEAQAVWQTTADRQGEALTLLYLSAVDSWGSDYAAAFEDLQHAHRLAREIDDEFAQVLILANIGNNFQRVDELERARDQYNASLALLAKIGNTHLKAEVLDEFGFYFESMGDRNGFRLYAQAAALAERAGDGLLYAVILSDLSRTSIAAGRAREALTYCGRELQIARKLDDPGLVALALRDTGEAYRASGKADLAYSFFTQALDAKLLGNNLAERAMTRIEQADALESLGRNAEASAIYRQTAKECQSLGAVRAEADARYRIARLENAEGRLDAALEEIARSVSLIEALRAKVSPDDTRTLWFASFQSIYKLYGDVLMQLSLKQAVAGKRGDAAQVEDVTMSKRAFQVCEQSIARTFVELLHDAQVDGGDTQELNSELAAVRRLQAEKTQQESQMLGALGNSAAVLEISSEIADLHGRAAEIESLIQGKEPKGRSMQVEPVGVDEVQAMIGDDELVLEYSLGDSRSYLWAVTKARFSSYELPPRAEIESLIRRYRDAVVSLSLSSIGEQSKTNSLKRNSEDEERLAGELGKMLLAPVRIRPELKRILVVADGGLQYLPFGVLMNGSNGGAGSGEMQRLADDHEVINLPSMTALAAMRHRTHLNGDPSNMLLVFADPVFENDDPRIEPQIVDRRKRSSTMDQAQRSGLPANLHFSRLPSSRREAGVIAGVAPEIRAKILLGFDANRFMVTSPEMRSYRFIHFATHSVFDDEHPESSGIVLSLFDHDGKPQDGFIRLKDIYNLKLSADLVVLSACDTALGKDIKGEGITGITRGFMYAGAPRVVATLWNVDDEATSEFMKWFYAGILEKHESPSAALREAQMEIRKQARWKSPYYWGAFVIEGD